jgi:hypothetical protein
MIASITTSAALRIGSPNDPTALHKEAPMTMPLVLKKGTTPRGRRLTTLGVSGLDLDDCSSRAMCLISAIFTGSCSTIAAN